MNLKTIIRSMKKQIITTFIIAAIAHANPIYSQEEFKPTGNVWGLVFGDYAYKTHNDTLQRGGANVQYRGTNCLNTNNTTANTNAPANVQSNAFQLRRVYLGYDYQFSKMFSATVVLANEQNYDASGKNTVYLKFANVKWTNIFKNSDLVVGQYMTCTYATPYNTELLMTYRPIERTIMDMHAIDNASDLGASLQGKIWIRKNAKDSLKPTFVGYYLQVGNGNGAIPETDIFKRFRSNVYASFLNQKLTIGLNGDYMRTQLSPYHTSNTTLKVYAVYKNEYFILGGEIFAQINKNSDIYKLSNDGIVAGTVKNDTANGIQMGWSVFASGRIIKNKLNVFARLDMFNPDVSWNKNNQYSKSATGVYDAATKALIPDQTFYKQTFITAGFDYTPFSRLHIMPNLWYSGYKTMMTTTGTAGTGTDLSSRIKNDFDLVYRLTFFFIFGK